MHEDYFDDLSWFYYGVIDSDGKVDYKQVNINTGSTYELPLYCASYDIENDKFYHLYYTANNWSYDEAKDFYYPIFENNNNALAYYKNGAMVSILNICDTAAYPTFKQKVPAISGAIADSLQGLINAYPQVDDFVGTIPTIIDAVAPLPGTVDYPKVVADKIADTAGVDTSDKTESSSTGYMGILEKILAAIKFFNNPIEAILTKWNILLDLLADIKVLWEEFVSSFPVEGEATNPNGQIDTEDDGASSESGGFLNLFNALWLLIAIVIILATIFLHLLEFIVNVFKIAPTDELIQGDFALGFNYIKTVELTPLNITIYDFLMGLIHIMIIFGIVKILKNHIDNIHL